LSTHFHSLKVSQVKPETRDAISVVFDVPPELAREFAYVPGQYLTLRTHIDGADVRRSYSICSALQDNQLRVAIKRVPGGTFSGWAADALKPGVSIDAMPPQGNFYLPQTQLQGRHILAVAAGSGITPILAIIKTALLAEPQSRVTLIYGNRASGSVMFRDELSDMKDSFLQRLNLVYIMSRESQDIALFNGRIDRDKCAALLDQWIDTASIDTAFICGPQDMMTAASEALQAHDLDKALIKTELFAASLTAHVPRASAAAGQGSQMCAVQVIADGVRRSFSMAKNNDNLVDAGIKAGLEMPYSCKGGVCSTCRAKVMSGEVEMDNNFALEDYEVARGFVLCCQSYPVTDNLVIDFDQEHAHN
jgi:ring-1,2-phenylacetyl-CoA epoxidase subunit PaaE